MDIIIGRLLIANYIEFSSEKIKRAWCWGMRLDNSVRGGGIRNEDGGASSTVGFQSFENPNKERSVNMLTV